ncbi:MAG: tRNA (adenosine(37)-N6)-threonylcarbamoyltransferase complex ATPase subunit type 1 TsaE [Eubacteriales bacterium]|nr:tRNA (adenosine(37)-N6)-threonylcarbamoyltransferase complex ATPase subunit type 1 TsaE [Eubacteriales bacterium]
MIYKSKNVKETMSIASNIAKEAKNGDIFCLVGDLGTGKTHFVKGFAASLGIKEDICSPTFTIVQEYNINLPKNKELNKLVHFDMYRIEKTSELIDIGFEEYIYSNNIIIIEWADLIKSEIPKYSKWIYFKKIGDNEREIIYKK